MTAPPAARAGGHLRLVGDDERAPSIRRSTGRELPALVVGVAGFATLAAGIGPCLVVVATGGMPGVYLGAAGVVGSAVLALGTMARLAPRPVATGRPVQPADLTSPAATASALTAGGRR